MKYLVDTDWAIDHLHNVRRVVQRLEELTPEGLGVSIVTLAELYEEIFNSTDPQGNERGLRDFLQGVSLVNLDEETCRIFGSERGRLRREGSMIADFDLMCNSHNLISQTASERVVFNGIDGWEPTIAGCSALSSLLRIQRTLGLTERQQASL